MKAKKKEQIVKENAQATKEVTEHKRVEERLRSERQKFQTLSEQAPFGMIMVNKDGTFGYINPKFKELFGYDLNDVPDGKTWFRKAYPDATYRHKVISDWVEQAKDSRVGERRPQTFIVTCKDGSEKIINFIAVLLETGENLVTCEDITERKRAEEILKQSYEKLRRTVEGAIKAIAVIAETRDPYTAGHQQRVAKLACAIAEELGLPEEQIETIRVAGIVHDIGKVSAPAEILSKPSKLNAIEISLIRGHPQVGRDILKTIELPWTICPIVLQHHERMDGSGYPSGLSGENILLEARILGVADVVEAMASHRPYRPALGIGKALEEISQNKGKLYDADVVDACLKLFYEKGFKFE